MQVQANGHRLGSASFPFLGFLCKEEMNSNNGKGKYCVFTVVGTHWAMVWKLTAFHT